MSDFCQDEACMHYDHDPAPNAQSPRGEVAGGDAVVTFEEADAALKTFREWEALASDIDGMWFVLKSDRERTLKRNRGGAAMSDPILAENEHRALATVIRDHFYATGNEMSVESTAAAVIAAGFHLHAGTGSTESEER